MIRSVLHTPGARQRLVAGVALAMALIPMAARADDEALIARSSARHIEVYAAGGANWCQPSLHLKMVLTSESADRGNPGAQVALLDKMRREFEQTCPTAERADANVTEDGNITGRFHAERSSGWTFAAVTPPATTPPAPSSTEPPPPWALSPDGSAPQSADATPAQPTPAAAQPAPTPAPAPPPAAPSITIPPAGDQNYWGYLLFAGKNDPSFFANADVQRCWAQGHMQSEWFRAGSDDFRQHEIMEKAGQDMQAQSSGIGPNTIYASIETEFGHYDFQTGTFPIEIRGDTLNLSGSCAGDGIPSRIPLHAPDMQSITGFAMSPEDARNFERKRENYGWMNRRIWVLMAFEVDPKSASGNGNQPAYSATLRGYAVYGNSHMETPIYQAGPEQIAAQRAQAAKIAAEKRQKELMARRDSEIQQLSNAPPPVRMANWINDDRPVELFRSLNNIRDTRFASMQNNGSPVEASFLVQTGGSGHKDVATTWPGHLDLTMADEKATFGDAGWYLVRGTLSTPTTGDFPDAQMTVVRAYACKQAQCADATDPTEIENRKIANATQAATGTPAP
ncbi:hypothetical protein [Novacetimonas cocois]|uniref:DUF4852 domain-containing protein n=1 Tax=Novacetimonas cocois TaxID=1747507 RepID=A0A365YZ34_9PROT|nr:hypothetical protein [Novacetimonas cocois]RBM08771.1 hypothetical protein NJLHNGOC_03100 [Novacetimonas cocois]